MIPQGYKTKLDSYQMQRAIAFIKQSFQNEFSENMNVKRVSAPLFVEAKSGLNDDLSGVERAVSFDIPYIGSDAQVVHSLAKWKRLALKNYQFSVHEGLYTDMNAIRRDETLDNLHSVYVDQWDWEKIILAEDRTIGYLKDTVQVIVNCISRVSEMVRSYFPQSSVLIDNKVSFVTSQELEDLYPTLPPEERENEYLKIHKTAFVMQIGDKLKSGIPHGNRAPDYDDWALNGDILFWNERLQRAFEISSMGIRVDPDSLSAQLAKAHAEARRNLPFHKMLLNGELPLTIGGGIGQSRLCMLLLDCAHIGEVQVSVWDEKTVAECKEKGVRLL